MKGTLVSSVTFALHLDSSPARYELNLCSDQREPEFIAEYLPVEVCYVCRDYMQRSAALWIVLKVCDIRPLYCLLRVTESGVTTWYESPDVVRVIDEMRRQGRMIHAPVPPDRLAALISTYRASLMVTEEIVSDACRVSPLIALLR